MTSTELLITSIKWDYEVLFHDLTAVSILAIKIMSFIIKDCGTLISLLTNSQPWHLCCSCTYYSSVVVLLSTSGL